MGGKHRRRTYGKEASLTKEKKPVPQTAERPSSSSQNPFTAPLDELVKHQADIVQRKAADVETKELGCITCAQFQADMRLRRVLQARVLDLTCDLVCRTGISKGSTPPPPPADGESCLPRI
jgi:hypothetical protein